ncbi:hypothetical protein RLW55_17215 [Hyphomicrobium sp. B1]|uniref:hypothetical protein n=1 Tax=unclassified Hyphomicrobium TaxID=2619925 RepID=UPI00391D0D0A
MNDHPFYLFTSVPPHLVGDQLEEQHRIIASWIAAGFSPVSVNGPSEIERVLAYGFDLDIEPCSSEGKPLVGDILEAVRKRSGPRAGIINSDCAILPYPNLAAVLADELEGGLLYAERIDVGGDDPPSIGNCYGFDAFFFDTALSRGIVDGHFQLGETWWDYWFPTQMAARGATLGNIDVPLITHRRHTSRWSPELWRFNARLHWSEMKLAIDAKQLPSFSTVIRDEEEGYLTRLAPATFCWLQSQKWPRPLSFLPPELVGLENILRAGHYAMHVRLPEIPETRPAIVAPEAPKRPKSMLSRANRARLHFQRRLFRREAASSQNAR